MNKLFAFLFILFFAYSAKSQRRFHVEITGQPQYVMGGGYSVPNSYDILASSAADFSEMKKAFTLKPAAGISAGWWFRKNMGIGTGLLYSCEGQNYNDYSFSDSTGSGNYSRKTSVDYLKIPVQFLFSPVSEKRVSPTFDAGIYLGIRARYKDELDYDFNNNGEIFGYKYTIIQKGDPVSQGSTLLGSTENTYIVFIDSTSFPLVYQTEQTTAMAFFHKPFNPVSFGILANAGIQIRITDRIFIPLAVNFQYSITDLKKKGSIHTDGTSSGLYWQRWGNDDPNFTSSFRSMAVGIKTGVRFYFNCGSQVSTPQFGM